MSEVCLDGGHVYWLEGRPQEQGRYVVVRAGADGQPTDVTPPPYNARTRVHEYGGGSWTVHNGTVYFSNFADGRLYRQVPGGSEPRPLTPEPPGRGRQWRYADAQGGLGCLAVLDLANETLTPVATNAATTAAANK